MHLDTQALQLFAKAFAPWQRGPGTDEMRLACAMGPQAGARHS
jgi:hypothetical protein